MLKKGAEAPFFLRAYRKAKKSRVPSDESVFLSKKTMLISQEMARELNGRVFNQRRQGEQPVVTG